MPARQDPMSNLLIFPVLGPVLVAVGLSGLPAPAIAQFRLHDEVAELCHAPPVTAAELDLYRIRDDFDLLLMALSDSCPEVAMLFATFSVGSVVHMLPRTPLDFTRHTEPHHLLTLVHAPQ